jgi:hypothetical protein
VPGSARHEHNVPRGEHGITAGLCALKGDTLGGFAPPLTFTQGAGHNVPYFYYLSIENGKFTAPGGSTPGQPPADLVEFGLHVGASS